MSDRSTRPYGERMSHVAIDPVHAESASAALDGAARVGAPASTSRFFTSSSSLGAAINLLEQRLAAVDRTLGVHLVTHAIEIRSAAEDAQGADR